MVICCICKSAVGDFRLHCRDSHDFNESDVVVNGYIRKNRSFECMFLL